MPDTTELEGLDPFAIHDRESARVERFFSSITDDEVWKRPTRCSEWTVRDLLGHLAGGETYHQACLDDALDRFIQEAAAANVTDLQSGNAWTVQSRAHLPPEAVVAEWKEKNADNRRRLRERGRNGTMATFVGPYPSWLQTFHIATELATHADDTGAPVEPDEAAERTDWRARFSRFVVAEHDRPVEITPSDGKNVVRAGGIEGELSDDDLVEVVAARLPADHPLDPKLRELLSTTP